jgi:hypothetical protein
VSINYWREVEYTDDGCSAFQCLNCYKQWEARTSPGQHTYECGECEYCVTKVWKSEAWSCYGNAKHRRYVPYFIYCPLCGVKWEGEMLRPENHRKAITQRILDTMPYEQRYKRITPKAWVIESKTPKYTCFQEHSSYDMGRYSARDMLKIKRDLEAAEIVDLERWDDNEFMLTYVKDNVKEFRIRINAN